MLIPPRIRQLPPVEPAEKGRREAEWDALRREAEQRRAEQSLRRRSLLETLGVPLADLAAAANCCCSCHPQPGDESQHPQSDCNCQLDEEQRRIRHAQLWDAFDAIWSDPQRQAASAREEQELRDAAERLGVSVALRGHAAPFVLSGTCDGRGWYLRERHGQYGVTIAPDHDPDVDPWSAPAEVPTIDIAEGDADEIGSTAAIRRVP